MDNDKLLDILLLDRTTGKNLIWATDNYESLGEGFQNKDFITAEAINSERGCVVKPRNEKSKAEQAERIRAKAEVFTPSWICNAQNNLVDNAWFEKDCVFNAEGENSWTASGDPILSFSAIPSRIRQQKYIYFHNLLVLKTTESYNIIRTESVPALTQGLISCEHAERYYTGQHAYSGRTKIC